MKYALSKMSVNEVVMSWNSQAEVNIIIILTKKNTSTCISCRDQRETVASQQ